jgi:WhiB family redox-sensing transcriptional regulator
VWASNASARRLFEAVAAAAQWQEQAACRDVPVAVFFPDHGSGHDGREAKQLCLTCPVRSECLDFAIDTRQVYGIWGGLNTNERRLIRNRRRQRAKV